MKYSADIIVEDNSKELFDCLKTEICEDERTQASFELKDNFLCVHIKCKDSTSLRAACNSITRLITVFESANKTGKKND